MDLREQPGSAGPRHPWETVRARFFTRTLVDALPRDRPSNVLDLGSGDAFVAVSLTSTLPSRSTVTCVDSGYTDAMLAELRAAHPASLTFARHAPLAEFDAVILLDVLEHVVDDEKLLGDALDALRPGGLALVSVPAYQALYTAHDVALGHHRRYTQRSLRELAHLVGLRVVRAGSLFASLVVPRALGKALETVRGHRSEPGTAPPANISTGLTRWTHGRAVTTAIESVLALDAHACALAARWSLPSLGLSTWALCTKETS